MKHIPFCNGISGSTLKLIAICSMFLDHTGATVFRALLNQPSVTASPFWFSFWRSAYSCSRSLGRIAFPIFCFLIVEGFSHTRNVWKYAIRMFLFALISEIPFDLALKGGWYNPDKQNVYFTLLIGLMVLIGLSSTEQLCKKITHNLSRKPIFFCCISCIQILISSLCIWCGMWLASWIDTDYNFKGVFLITVLYLVHHYSTPSSDSKLVLCLSGAAAVSWELPAPLGFLPVYLYNGTRGLRVKYLFYWFYPVHLLVLHIIADCLIPLI